MYKRTSPNEPFSKLTELNTLGVPVSADILNSIMEPSFMIKHYGPAHIFKLVKLLEVNPIQFNEEIVVTGVFLKINDLISDISELNFRFYIGENDCSEEDVRILYHNMLSLWDKIFYPTFNDHKNVKVDWLFWIAYSQLIRFPDHLLIERLVAMIKSRLPTSEEDWRHFGAKTIHPDYYYLNLIIGELKANDAYWTHYLKTQTLEYFGEGIIIANEWADELLGSPLEIRFDLLWDGS